MNAQIGQDKFVDEFLKEKENGFFIDIENNYQTNEIKDFLEEKGYYLHCKLQWDDIFIKL